MVSISGRVGVGFGFDRLAQRCAAGTTPHRLHIENLVIVKYGTALAIFKSTLPILPVDKKGFNRFALGHGIGYPTMYS